MTATVCVTERCNERPLRWKYSPLIEKKSEKLALISLSGTYDNGAFMAQGSTWIIECKCKHMISEVNEMTSFPIE